MVLKKLSMQEGKLLYFDRDKGFFITMLGGALLGLFFLVRFILSLVANYNSLVRVFIDNTAVSLFGVELTLPQITQLLIVFYIFKLIDGFFDGIIMTTFDLIVVVFIITLGLNAGDLVFRIGNDSLAIHFEINFILVLGLLLVGYIWILIWEIVLLVSKTNLLGGLKDATHSFFSSFKQIFSKKSSSKDPSISPEPRSYPDVLPNSKEDSERPEILKPLQLNHQKKTSWIDREAESVCYDTDEKPILSQWTDVNGRFKHSPFRFFLFEPIMLFVFGFIYAGITYLVSEQNALYLDSTCEAFFFPVWLLIFSAYRSPRHWLRALIFLILTMVLQFELYYFGLISLEGLFILSFVIPISRWFFFDLGILFQEKPIRSVITFLIQIESIIMGVLLAVMLFYRVYSKLKRYNRFEIQISTKYLYFREKRTFNNYDIIGNILMALVWPFNVQTYVEVMQQIRYKSKSLKESWAWDYGRLDLFECVKNITRKREDRKKTYLKIMILLIIGGSSITSSFLNGVFLNLSAFAFIFWALRELWLSQKRRYTIQIKFHRIKTHGSLFILHPENSIELIDIEEELAALIPSVETYRT